MEGDGPRPTPPWSAVGEAVPVRRSRASARLAQGAEKCKKVHFFAKMGPAGAGAPKPKYVGTFLRSAEAHFAKKCTFSQKVHFSAISAPGRR